MIWLPENRTESLDGVDLRGGLRIAHPRYRHFYDGERTSVLAIGPTVPSTLRGVRVSAATLFLLLCVVACSSGDEKDSAAVMERFCTDWSRTQEELGTLYANSADDFRRIAAGIEGVSYPPEIEAVASELADAVYDFADELGDRELLSLSPDQLAEIEVQSSAIEPLTSRVAAFAEQHC